MAFIVVGSDIVVRVLAWWSGEEVNGGEEEEDDDDAGERWNWKRNAAKRAVDVRRRELLEKRERDILYSVQMIERLSGGVRRRISGLDDDLTRPRYPEYYSVEQDAIYCPLYNHSYLALFVFLILGRCPSTAYSP